MARIVSIFALLVSVPFVSLAQEVHFDSNTIGIGMIVSDLDASMRFYTEVIGMKHMVNEDFSVDGSFGKTSGLTDGLSFDVKVLKLGEGNFPTQLKLMSFGNTAMKQQNRFIHTQTGVQYLTIMVFDLQPVLDRIKMHKVPMLGQTPVPLSEGRQFILVQDPDGTFVELIGKFRKEGEMPPARPAAMPAAQTQSQAQIQEQIRQEVQQQLNAKIDEMPIKETYDRTPNTLTAQKKEKRKAGKRTYRTPSRNGWLHLDFGDDEK